MTADELMTPTHITLTCPDCKSNAAYFDDKQPPWFETSHLLVAPVICHRCGYSYSMVIDIRSDYDDSAALAIGG